MQRSSPGGAGRLRWDDPILGNSAAFVRTRWHEKQVPILPGKPTTKNCQSRSPRKGVVGLTGFSDLGGASLFASGFVECINSKKY